MKALSCVVAATALAGSVAGCADPYYYSYSYPRYGYSQAYYYPSSYSYSYPSSYAYYSSAPYYYPRGYYSSDWDYYRHYNGIHAGPELSAAGTVP
jgi:hypothetical protein